MEPWVCQHRSIGSVTTPTPRPGWAVLDQRATTVGGHGRLITGTASALATALGVEPLVARLGFIVLAAAGGWGVIAYLAVWAWFAFVAPPADAARDVPSDEAMDAPAPVADTHHRDLGFGLVVLGLVVQARLWGVGFSDAVVWPLALIAVGIAVAWRRVGDTEVWSWLGGEDTVADSDRGRSARTVRVALGALLVVVGSASLIGAELTWSAWMRTMLGLLVVLTGVAVILGPTLRAMGEALVDERRRRIRADERAVISSHLHDSVLQTLALIQKRSDDPASVAALARRQERELRQWLYGRAPEQGGTLRLGLEEAAAEVEDQYGVAVEIVVVGDGPLDERLAAVVAAAREAMVNAAKFSGDSSVAVFAEVSAEEIEVFVRDRGVGFDLEGVPEDRRGLADSIVGRLTRLGGDAVIRTAPGDGTEVQLRLARGHER